MDTLLPQACIQQLVGLFITTDKDGSSGQLPTTASPAPTWTVVLLVDKMPYMISQVGEAERHIILITGEADRAGEFLVLSRYTSHNSAPTA